MVGTMSQFGASGCSAAGDTGSPCSDSAEHLRTATAGCVAVEAKTARRATLYISRRAGQPVRRGRHAFCRHTSPGRSNQGILGLSNQARLEGRGHPVLRQPDPDPPSHQRPRCPRGQRELLTQKNCISDPSACGYPDTGNTGVPPNEPLTNSGSVTVTAPGAVISGLNVTGTIYVNADNVTIKDTRVTNSSPSGWAIHVDSHVSGTLIEDSTISGQDAGSNAVEYAVSNGGTGTRAVRLQMSNCTECYAGPGLLQDSYAITNAVVSGAHYEAVYYGGGSEALNVQHNTLLNPHTQTASVYAGTDFGPQQNLVINNNLLAGGGSSFMPVRVIPGHAMSRSRITASRLSTTRTAVTTA